jgi:hypothetical protein
MRGAGPSFGITTSITVKTFPEPSITTIYQYNWNMNSSAVAKAISSFQKFSQTNIPKEYSAELALFKGKAAGQLQFSFTGGWYGPTDKLNGIIKPYLDTLPEPDSIGSKSGSYIDSLRLLGGLGHLSTQTPDSRNTFYAKSLMTPEASPISDTALAAFTDYLANAGFKTNLVSPDQFTFRLVSPRERTGLSKWSCMAERTLLSMRLHRAQHLLGEGTLCGQSRCTRPRLPINRRSPATGSLFLTVRAARRSVTRIECFP